MSILNKNKPVAYQLTVATASTFGGANKLAITGTAQSLMIDATQAHGTGIAVTAQFNGDSNCQFPITAGSCYTWTSKDIRVNQVDFANPSSTSGSDQPISVIAG